MKKRKQQHKTRQNQAHTKHKMMIYMILFLFSMSFSSVDFMFLSIVLFFFLFWFHLEISFPNAQDHCGLIYSFLFICWLIVVVVVVLHLRCDCFKIYHWQVDSCALFEWRSIAWIIKHKIYLFLFLSFAFTIYWNESTVPIKFWSRVTIDSDEDRYNIEHNSMSAVNTNKLTIFTIWKGTFGMLPILKRFVCVPQCIIKLAHLHIYGFLLTKISLFIAGGQTSATQ